MTVVNRDVLSLSTSRSPFPLSLPTSKGGNDGTFQFLGPTATIRSSYKTFSASGRPMAAITSNPYSCSSDGIAPDPVFQTEKQGGPTSSVQASAARSIELSPHSCAFWSQWYVKPSTSKSGKVLVRSHNRHPRDVMAAKKVDLPANTRFVLLERRKSSCTSTRLCTPG